MIKKFENFVMKLEDPFADEIIDILKKNRYKVSTYSRIYQSTIDKDDKYMNGVYRIKEHLSDDILYEDVLFLEKMLDDEKVEYYQDIQFYYMSEKIYNLFNDINVLVYKELPFFDELREIAKKYGKMLKVKDFNL